MKNEKATILFVDDDEVILQVGRAMLEKLGYNLVTAASVSEAAEIYTQKVDDVDLVILDLKMPGGGGTDAFNRIKEINPSAKILISTGSGHTPEAAAFNEPRLRRNYRKALWVGSNVQGDICDTG